MNTAGLSEIIGRVTSLSLQLLFTLHISMLMTLEGKKDQLPFLLAGEKKLKTGEKMVPSSVVRGGLLGASVCISNFPLGFTSLL